MIVISYNNISLGGLGDRIIGLISCKLIAKLLNKKFYINWTKENVKEYTDYSKYDYELLEKNNLSVKEYRYIDFERSGRLSRNRVRDTKGTCYFFILIFPA